MQNTALATISPDGEPTTTSLVIAEHTGNQHKNVIALVRAHLGDIEEFGRVAFETRVAGQSPNPAEVAILNEPQATLLIKDMWRESRDLYVANGWELDR